MHEEVQLHDLTGEQRLVLALHDGCLDDFEVVIGNAVRQEEQNAA